MKIHNNPVNDTNDDLISAIRQHLDNHHIATLKSHTETLDDYLTDDERISYSRFSISAKCEIGCDWVIQFNFRNTVRSRWQQISVPLADPKSLDKLVEMIRELPNDKRRVQEGSLRKRRK